MRYNINLENYFEILRKMDASGGYHPDILSIRKEHT
jgi:hypothetical protein